MNGQAKNLFIKSGNQGNTWFSAYIPVTSTTPYQLVFEAIIGGQQSDIAIDDVNYSAGYCPPPGKWAGKTSAISTLMANNEISLSLMHTSTQCTALLGSTK